MTTNAAYCPAVQERLFEEPDLVLFPSGAVARNHYGNAAEDIACAALDLVRLPIDGRCSLCFDARSRDGESYYEIKSVRLGGSCPVWNWRLKKDAESGLPIFYVFVLHNAKGSTDTHHLWERLSATVREVYVVPLSRVVELHAPLPTQGTHEQSSSRSFGHARAGYCDGYRRVRMTHIREGLSRAEDRAFALNGLPFNLTVRHFV